MDAVGAIFPWLTEMVINWVLTTSAAEIAEFGNHHTLDDDDYMLFIKIEKLYFKYLDDRNYSHCPYLTYGQFAGIIIHHLANHNIGLLNYLNERLDGFPKYWNARPRVGGVILDYTGKFILLVRPPHSWSWSFPKRKLEPLDDELARAITEVEEETGIDFEADECGTVTKEVLNSDGVKISIKLFYMRNICAINSTIKPHSHQEIGGARWFNIDYLSSRTDLEVQYDPEFGTAAWKSIKPFLDDIRRVAYKSSRAHHHDYEEKSYREFGDVRFD